MGTRDSLRSIAQILWGGWELYGLITWIGGGILSNIFLFLLSPFVQEIPFYLKMLYGLGLFAAFFIISVLIFWLIRVLFKSQANSVPSQIISESPKAQQAGQAGNDITQVQYYVVNNFYFNTGETLVEKSREKEQGK